MSNGAGLPSPGRNAAPTLRDRAALVSRVLRGVEQVLSLACQAGLFGQFAVILKFEDGVPVHYRTHSKHEGKRLGEHYVDRKRRSLARIERAIRGALEEGSKAGFYGALRLNFEHSNGAAYYQSTEHETGHSLLKS